MRVILGLIIRNVSLGIIRKTCIKFDLNRGEKSAYLNPLL